jgi:nucleoside-diphosphate-sugar epimerase
LGSHLLFKLTEDDTAIRALYREQARLSRVKKLFEYYDSEHGSQRFSRIEWVEGDILDVMSLDAALNGVSIVYHSAALVSFARRDFHRLMKINRYGTANVVNCSLHAGVKKLCYVSSTAAIGGQPDSITTEDTTWKQSKRTSSYSVSKYSAEKEVWRGVEEGLDCVIVNPCVIFGPGDWNESSLTIFRTVEKGLRFYTDGTNAIVDVRDVAEIMVRLTNSDTKNERFLCIGENLPFRKMTDEIADQMGKKRASMATPRWLIGLAWRISALTGFIRGKAPAVTKDTAYSAFSKMEYDASKVRKRLNFAFRTYKDTVENVLKAHRS